MDRGLHEAKSIIKSLIISCPQGITIGKLDKDYRDTVGSNIPYARLGFPNLELFLKSLTDTLVVYGSGTTAKVAAICDKKTKHLEEMISRQKNASRDRRNLTVSKKPPKSTPTPPLLNLPPVVTISHSPVYYNTQYNKTTFHPQHTWVSVPCSNYYNYNNYTSPTNYHWNIPPNQLNQEIMDLQNKLNKLNIYSKPRSTGHTTTTESNRYAAKSPIKINRSNFSMQQSNITKVQPQSKPHLQPQPEPEYQPQPRSQSQSQPRSQSQSQPQPQLRSQFQPQFQPQPQSQSRLKAELQNTELVAVENQRNASVNDLKDLSVEEPKKPLSFKINRKYPKVQTPNKYFNGRKSSSSETSESTSGALRNISSDLDETKKVSENKDKGKISDNEAIPELAHNDIIFLLDYPSGSVTFGQKIQPTEIPGNIVKDSWFRIFVTEIHNPYKFWFHIYKENSELDSLMQDIENFYMKLSINEFQIQNSYIKPGQVCAALFMGMWHRAEILDEPVGKKVKLFFVDYGTVAEVPVSEIKYLLNEFSALSCQAYRGSLAFIKPFTHRWSRDCTYAFCDMVNELLLYAKVTEVDQKERRIRLIITDTNDETDFQINEALVFKGLAKFCDEEFIRYKQKEPLTAIDRHFQDKYPTFEMLESGEYPTFLEIGALLAKGIDFEAREDENILPDVDENCSLEEITKKLTTFNVSELDKSDTNLEEVEDLPTTPDSEFELNGLEDTDVQSETKANLERKKQVLNPFINPFIPKSQRTNTEDIMPNSLEITRQYSTVEIVPSPTLQLQPNSYDINPFNMPMMTNNMQYYNSPPSCYNTMSMPGVQTLPVQTGPLDTSNWNQFTNVPNILNPPQGWIQSRPNIPPGFENQIPQASKDLFYFR